MRENGKRLAVGCFIAAGTMLLIWGSMELPGRFFAVLDEGKQGELLAASAEPIRLNLSENPEPVEADLEDKLRIVNGNGLVSYAGENFQGEVKRRADEVTEQFRTELEKMRNSGLWTEENMDFRLEEALAGTAYGNETAYPVLYCDGLNMNRRFWVWSFAVDLAGERWSGWLDDETGLILKAEGEKGELAGEKFLLRYYRESGELR